MSTKPSITPLPNGPYVVKDPAATRQVECLADDAGRAIPNAPYVALCRCGGSKNKPFCDGTHLVNGFRSEKAADRTPDRRKSYASPAIAVHDNRGICAHAGHCTSALPAVFREDDKPWIVPTAATADAIASAVRRCPSGALSHSVAGVEHRDQDRAARVVVSKDGPYEVEGGIELVGAEFGDGASREHYCLCRCGGSKNKPFCDGAHGEIGFRG